jgi:hypothetical protein
VARVLPVLAASLTQGRAERRFPGPTRDEALAILARVAERRATRGRRRAPREAPAGPRLDRDSDVAGHA